MSARLDTLESVVDGAYGESGGEGSGGGGEVDSGEGEGHGAGVVAMWLKGRGCTIGRATTNDEGIGKVGGGWCLFDITIEYVIMVSGLLLGPVCVCVCMRDFFERSLIRPV